MSNNKHQWKQFANPRNGLIKIEACEVCGIAKSMVSNASKCSKEKKNMRLKGWYVSNENDKKTTQDYISKYIHDKLSPNLDHYS